MKRALEWLEAERNELRRLAACLILTRMADNAPTVFNVHVPGFINTIWFGLRDTKMTIRERACGALRACLIVVEKRETRYRVQWYYKLFEETVKGLGKGASVESVHGSLMAVGELLGHSGEFMLARYKEVSAHACMRDASQPGRMGLPLGCWSWWAKVLSGVTAPLFSRPSPEQRRRDVARHEPPDDFLMVGSRRVRRVSVAS